MRKLNSNQKKHIKELAKIVLMVTIFALLLITKASSVSKKVYFALLQAATHYYYGDALWIVDLLFAFTNLLL